MNRPKDFRSLIAQPGIVVAPSAYDCLSARLIEQAGFPMVTITGSGLITSMLGVPDLGQTSITEVVDRIRCIVDAIGIPVLADAEAGCDGIVNVMRTVSLLERAGVGGLFMEDQQRTRQLGHFTVIENGVIPIEEMVLKIKAAVKARENPDFVIQARTDACSTPEGLSGALTRARAYAEAGADSLFILRPGTIDQYAEVAESLRDLGLPLRANLAESPSAVQVSIKELESMGYKFATMSGACWRIAAQAMSKLLSDLATTGSIEAHYSEMAPSPERDRVLGLQNYLDFEKELLKAQ